MRIEITKIQVFVFTCLVVGIVSLILVNRLVGGEEVRGWNAVFAFGVIPILAILLVVDEILHSRRRGTGRRRYRRIS